MGLNLLFSGGGSPAPQPPMPNPDVFEIQRVEAYEHATIAEIHYPGCTTFEGRKLIVFACHAGKVIHAKRIDPHFMKEGDLIARFEPTLRGWRLARLVAETISASTATERTR